MRPTDIDLQIDELVLHGFAPGDRYRIAEAVRRELGRLLGEQGIPPSLGDRVDLGRIDAGSIEAPAGARPEAVGAQVARAIYGGLGR